VPEAETRLEVGPGLRPRLPVTGTHFVDASRPAVERLSARGGLAQWGDIAALPFSDATFDLIAAFDVIEHVSDDRRVFAELTRVLKTGGTLIFSVPLHPARWTVFDDYVGHARRYQPAELLDMLAKYGLVVEKSATFGMQARNPRMLRYAVKVLTEHRAAATRWYNWFLLPLGLLLQKRLKLADGVLDLTGADEILLVCQLKRSA
jgi:SAM-dependent methyltransferase